MLTALSFGWILAPTVIIPPADPVNPINVYVLDRGYHSRLILPGNQGGLIQYAYGDWRYFALNQQDWQTGLAALFLPTQGTLGRQTFRDLPDLAQEVKLRPSDTLLKITVAGAEVAQLRRSLQNRFQQHWQTRTVNPRNGITFVQDDQDYTLLHNSNHEVASWLRALDCRVRGFILWPDFKFREPGD